MNSSRRLNRRNSSRRRNSNQVRTNKSLTGVLRTRLNGSTFRVNPDPTSTVDRPWNNVVLSFSSTTSGSLTLGAVKSAFNAQVGSGDTTPNMFFRLQELRTWELTGGNLSVDILDLQAAQDTHRTGHDEPGRNHWSTVGLAWSTTQTNNTLTSTETDLVIARAFSSMTTTNLLFHLKLLWRFAETPTPSVRAIQPIVNKHRPLEQIIEELAIE